MKFDRLSNLCFNTGRHGTSRFLRLWLFRTLQLIIKTQLPINLIKLRINNPNFVAFDPLGPFKTKFRRNPNMKSTVVFLAAILVIGVMIETARKYL